MRPIENYDDVKVNNFDSEKVELGGHILKILEAKVESYSAKDGRTFEQLIIKFDIEQPDPQAGFYQRRFTADARNDALNAKWKGIFRLNIPEDKPSEGNEEMWERNRTNFKTFTTSVEDSNPGYKWNWEEATLAGKLFGGVFGLEEFETPDGKVIAFARCRFPRGIEKVLEAPIPKVRLLDKTYIDYEEYLERKENKAEAEGKAMEEDKGTIEDDSSLPF